MRRLRKFADVRLGEAIFEGAPSPDGKLNWEDRAGGLVREWAGAEQVRCMHLTIPSPADRPRDLSGRIYARHLDSSRCVDVEVIARDRGRICARAVIRAALA